MALNEVDPAANRYTMNGVTTVTAYTFEISSKNDLEALINTTTKTVDVDYSVDGIGNSGGGNVTWFTAPANGTTVTLLRKQPAVQASVYTANQGFPHAQVMADFDKLWMAVQQMREQLHRAMLLPKSSALVDQGMDVPTVGSFARGKVGGGIDWATVVAAGSISTPVAVNEGGTGATTAAGARTALDVPSTTEAVFKSIKQAVRNPIINGAMEIWQRGTTFAAAANGAYTADRWKWRQVGTTAVVTVNRSTNVPTVAQAGVLFNYSLEVDVTTADAAVAAGDIAILETDIEGYNWRHFAQRTFIVSFWVRDTITGSHYLALANTSEDTVNNINYLGAYTITSSDTWEYKTVQVTASPSAGTWNYTNGIGLRLKFILMAGTNYNGATEGQWNGGGSQAVANSPANSLSNTANFFRITGVKLELGSVATPIQYVPFEEELMRCMRYYQKSFAYATAPVQNAGLSTGAAAWYAPATATASAMYSLHFPVRMRTVPNMTGYNPSAANAQSRNQTDGADDGALSFGATEWGGNASFTPNATNTAGDIHLLHWSADAEL